MSKGEYELAPNVLNFFINNLHLSNLSIHLSRNQTQAVLKPLLELPINPPVGLFMFGAKTLDAM